MDLYSFGSNLPLGFPVSNSRGRFSAY